jgi:hypothetical protein
MSELTTVFNLLGQTVVPAIGAAAFPDTMTITAETTSQGTGGGMVKSATSNAHTNVPCAYKPNTGRRVPIGDKLVSVGDYTVVLPTHTAAGTRINLDPKTHSFVVNARGNEPAKTFRIEYIGDHAGVKYEVLCTKEN